MDLTVPVNFVLPEDEVWPEMVSDRLDAVDDELLSQRCTTPVSYWINHTYVQFRRAGLRATFSTELRDDVVNIAEGTHIGIRSRPHRAFLVTTRGDGHFPYLANHAIEQNHLGGPQANRSVITGWGQPGLIPRDPKRGSRIEVLSFKGSIRNLAEPFRSDAFRRALAALGVELRVDTHENARGNSLAMHDYRDVDAVLAVRDLTELDYLTKPPNKVFNCWHAGVPAIVGPEPAYAEIRRSPFDFVVVRTPADALGAIRALKADSNLYRRIIENGTQRSPEYSVSAILSRWLRVLNGPIRKRFELWQSSTDLKRRTWFGTRVPLEMAARRAEDRRRNQGKRGPGTAAIPSFSAESFGTTKVNRRGRALDRAAVSVNSRPRA